MKHITRDHVRANPRQLFVFGDNMARRGYGGQAKEIRGEPNTIGIPTKWFPDRQVASFFSDADWENDVVRWAITDAFEAIETALADGRDVVVPADGVGSGLSELDKRAPFIAAFIRRRFEEIERPCSPTS